MKAQTVVVLTLVFMFMLTSCGDDSTGTRGPNLPPDTQIVSGPDSGSTASYLAQIHWMGTDDDGRVVGFEFVWLEGAVSLGELDTLSGVSWEYTQRTDSLFAVRADSCDGSGLCHRQNTFFIRAVDNGGAVDPEPSRLTYTATTLPPRAQIIYPTEPGQTTTNQPRCVTVRWEGLDEDGEAVRYRSTFKPYGEWPGPGIPYPQWDKTHWTPWSSSTEAILPLNEDETKYTWSFFVQAEDNAGAIETAFQAGRNHIIIEIDPSKESKPSVDISVCSGQCTQSGPAIDTRSSTNPSGMSVPVYIPVGDTVCFRVSFQPGRNATYVDGIAFRINDADRPMSWENATYESNWHYPPYGDFIVGPGINTIYAWVRDDYCEYGSTNHVYMEVIGTY